MIYLHLPFFLYFGSWLHYNHKYAFVNEICENFLKNIFRFPIDILRGCGIIHYLYHNMKNRHRRVKPSMSVFVWKYGSEGYSVFEYCYVAIALALALYRFALGYPFAKLKKLLGVVILGGFG